MSQSNPPKTKRSIERHLSLSLPIRHRRRWAADHLYRMEVLTATVGAFHYAATSMRFDAVRSAAAQAMADLRLIEQGARPFIDGDDRIGPFVRQALKERYKHPFLDNDGHVRACREESARSALDVSVSVFRQQDPSEAWTPLETPDGATYATLVQVNRLVAAMQKLDEQLTTGVGRPVRIAAYDKTLFRRAAASLGVTPTTTKHSTREPVEVVRVGSSETTLLMPTLPPIINVIAREAKAVSDLARTAAAETLGIEFARPSLVDFANRDEAAVLRQRVGTALLKALQTMELPVDPPQVERVAIEERVWHRASAVGSQPDMFSLELLNFTHVMAERSARQREAVTPENSDSSGAGIADPPKPRSTGLEH